MAGSATDIVGDSSRGGWLRSEIDGMRGYFSALPERDRTHVKTLGTGYGRTIPSGHLGGQRDGPDADRWSERVDRAQYPARGFRDAGVPRANGSGAAYSRSRRALRDHRPPARSRDGYE